MATLSQAPVFIGVLENEFERLTAQKQLLSELAFQAQKVIRISISTVSIEANVQDSPSAHFHVILVKEGRNLRSHCSCPAGYNCEHVGACILEGIKHLKSRSGQVSLSYIPNNVDKQKQIKAWLESINTEYSAPAVGEKKDDRQVIFTIETPSYGECPALSVLSVKRKLNGEFGKSQPYILNWRNPDSASSQKIRESISESDWEIVSFITKRASTKSEYALPLNFADATEALRRIIQTGRLFIKNDFSRP